MYKFVLVIILFLFFMIPLQAIAEEGDVFVGDVSISSLSWGDQNFIIELTNKTEYLKFITVKSDLSFKGNYLNPSYQTTKNYILYPSDSVTINSELFIPGNYGDATINLQMYDVIDTLDELMPWQKFHTQPFMLKFKPSNEIFPYLQNKIVLPPRVDVHPFFNNEFSRLLFVLISEGKSAEDIAFMNECSVAFVQSEIDKFVKRKLISVTQQGYSLNFAVISLAEAEKARPIAEKVADSLVVLLKQNIKEYPEVLDSLIKVKTIPNDSNDFISGASFLFKKTPMVSTMTLWYELGSKFITRSAPLRIYDGTNICNADNVQYMYAVNGGDFFNGKHFFGLFLASETYSIMFAHDGLDILCEDFNSQKNQKGVWKYNHPNYPEYFIVDTTKARPIINRLTTDCDKLLSYAYDEMKINAQNHGQDHIYIGQRYWFWNLIATLTLDKLYAKM